MKYGSLAIVMRACFRWCLVGGLLLAAGFGRPSFATTDVIAVSDRLIVTERIEWCLTPRDLRREQLGPETCRWAPLTSADARPGFEARAAWLRLRLSNSSAEPVERWVEVGHQRLSEVQLQYRTADGAWRVHAVGLDVPLATRSDNAQRYGVLPVSIAPGDNTDILIRVQTTTLMVLDTSLWAPAAYRNHRIETDIWLALSVGTLMLVILFSLLMSLITREPHYAMLCLGLLGETIIETTRTGFMMRYFWPETLPFPVTMTVIGGMCSLLGFFGFVDRVIVAEQPAPRRDRLLKGLAGIVLLAMIYTIFIDYRVGTTLWSVLAIPLILLLAWSSWRTAQLGEKTGYWVVMVFVIMGTVGVLRLPSAMLRLPPTLTEELISPIATMVVSTLVMMAIVERVRQVQRELSSAQTVAAAQISFLARMSHELRTPLDTILGNTQLLMRPERRNGESGGPESLELKSILQSGRHLLGMVDEILDYARGVSGALHLRKEPVSLPDFVASIDTVARVLAIRNRNRFELRDLSTVEKACPTELRLDAGRLRQVLDNLLSNAARHTQDGMIRLDYRLESVGARCWRIHFAIADTGEGIAQEYQAKIFEPFERVGRGARYGGKGAGMGLAVARQLVGLMGGELSLESALGRGTTIEFSILAEEVEGRPAERSSPADDPREVIGYEGARRRVLVVDDEVGSRAIVTGLLRAVGFEVDEAEGGNEAVGMLRGGARYDVVVTDQFMPEGDGWKVLEGVHALEATVPCALISAAPPSPPDFWPAERRFAACFLKPLDHAGFLHILGNLLGLTWIRASAPVSTPPTAPLLRPGSAELAELQEMIEFGELTAIVEWAQRLRHRVPECAVFADRVEAAATDLDFVTLNHLAEPSPP
jgi:signal transduction histidine kinase/CheY-like chemotaxis protein